MNAVLSIAGTLAKLARGGPRDPAPGIAARNVGAALRYILARKLTGRAVQPVLRLGFGGRRHPWRLERREDLTVLEEVFLDEDYHLDITPPRVIFDLGANFGAASVYFALRWPEARVVAVEANPEMAPRLRATTAPYENVTVIEAAAGAEDGTMPFTISASSVGGGLNRPEPGARIVDVDVRSLASLMAEAGADRIDLLKFDIEGAEGLLFRDPAILSRVRAFVGEIHPDLMDEPADAFAAKFAAFDTTRVPLPMGRFLLKGTRRAE